LARRTVSCCCASASTALPQIFVALRLASSSRLVGAIVGEGSATHRPWCIGCCRQCSPRLRRDLGALLAAALLGTGFYAVIAAATALVSGARAMTVRRRHRLARRARGILGVVLLVLCWEGLARGLHLPSYVLPAVSEIWLRSGQARAAWGSCGYTC